MPYRAIDLSLTLSFISILSLFYLKDILFINVKKDSNLIKAFKTILTVNISLLPLILYYYGSVNLLLIPVNLIVVPIFSATFALVFLKIILYFTIRPLAYFISFLIDFLLDIIYFVVDLFSGIDFFKFSIKNMNYYFVIVLFLLVLYFIFERNYIRLSLTDKIKGFKIIAILILSFSFIFEIASYTSLSMIDIGQGDAFLISDGKLTGMIDTGGDIKGSTYKFILGPYLKKRVKKLDFVIISHDDIDHSGNLKYIVRDYDPIIFTSEKSKISSPKRKILKNEDIIKSTGFSIKVLDDGKEYDESNNTSLVLSYKQKGFSALFTGDMEVDKEKNLSMDLKHDILKVGHHGSMTSTSDDFLKKVNPKIALISAGYKNKFSHPHKETIEKLEKYGVRYFRTDRDGEVRITSSVFGNEIKHKLRNKKSLASFLLGDLLYIIVLTGTFTLLLKDLFKENDYELYRGYRKI